MQVSLGSRRYLRVLAARRLQAFRRMGIRADEWSIGMDRTEKTEAVSSLNATLSSAASVVVVRNLGMTVAQSTVLRQQMRSEEHTSELQSLMRISYAVFCLK